MNKYVVLGIFAAIFVAGLAVIIVQDSISFTAALRSLRDLSPIVLSLLILPFIAVLFVLGIYIRKKNEELKWKKALLKTRAGKQK